MLIDVCSDLHVAHFKGQPIDWQARKNKGSKALVIAGDLGHYESDIYDILDKAHGVYEQVIIVDGNHEHYTTREEVSKFTARIQKLIKKTYKNVTFLNGNNFIRINNTVFIGANGWYDWKIMEPLYGYDYCNSVWKRGLNDFRYILFDDNNVNYGPDVLAEKQSKQLKKLVKKFQKDDTIDNIIVTTHTSPLKELLIIKNDPSWDSLTASFGNSQMKHVVEADTNHKIKAWVYGHTHQRNDQTIGNIRYVNNARGYPRENDETGPWILKQIEVK